MAYKVDPKEAVDTYADMVYRLALVNTNQEMDAEDVFQNVFLKLIKYKDSIISEEHLKAWLIRVCINECRTYMSSAWKRKKVSLDSVGEMAALEKEDMSDVTEAVLRLPDKYKEVIHLYYYEELSIRDIASIMDMSEGAIKTRLRRGREILSRDLKKEYGLDGRV